MYYRSFKLFFFCLVLAFYVAGCVETPVQIVTLKQGAPNTITLSNGEVVYDLNGLWDGTYHNYGHGTNKETVRIKQVGNEFIGWKTIGNRWVGKGNETLKGTLKDSHFSEIFSFDDELGWKETNAIINNNGNELVFWDSICKISLKKR